jgi:hypothetical protein
MQEDPPTVNMTAPKDVVIIDSLPMTANTGTYSLTQLKAQIADQVFGGGAPTFFFQIESIKAWAPSAASGEIAMTDLKSGVTVSDFGSLSYRAKVGLHYSPILQTVYETTATTDVVEIGSAGATDLIDMRISVRTWCSVTSLTARMQQR